MEGKGNNGISTIPPRLGVLSPEIGARATDRRDSVQSGIKELESNGYLARVPKRGDKGRMDGWEWHIFEDGNGNTFQPKDSQPKDGNPADGYSARRKTRHY